MTVGMKCPECGAWTEVLESRRPKTDNYIYRRRECGNGHRFTTHEQVAYIDAPRRKADRLEVLESISKGNGQGVATTDKETKKTKGT